MGARKSNFVIKLLFFLFMIWAVIFVIMILTKPSQDDFTQWFSEKYDVHCEFDECNSFDLEVTDNGKTENVKFVKHSGITSETPTSITIERNYYSETTKFFIRIKVKGSLGNFKILKEDVKLSYTD